MSDPVIGLVGDPVPSEARWCEATVGGIRIVSVYTPRGRALDSPEFPRKLAFLAERLRACGIDREYRKGTKPSDHAPLLVDLAGAGH